MKCPILMLAGAFALGVLAGQAAGLLVPLLAGAGCAVVAWLCLWQQRNVLAWILVLAGFACGGAACACLFQARFPANHISHMGGWGLDLAQPVTLKGTLADTPLLAPYGIQFDLQVAQVSDGREVLPATGKIRLRVLNGRKSSLPAAALGLGFGETIEARVHLSRPRNDKNPGGFDYRRWMESIQDIYWQGIVAGPQDIRHAAGPAPSGGDRLIESVRERLEKSIDLIYPPWSVNGRDGAVLKAILLGDRSSLDSNTIEDFRKSGLYHLLVVAGLHVGLLVLLAGGLLRLLRLRESWRTPLLLLFLAVYAVIVEQRAPTLRASLMIGAYLVARWLDREQPALNAIGLAALILLFHRPAWLLDSGFQLSFAAALLIAGVAAPILERTTEPYRRGLWRLGDVAFDQACAPRAAQFRLDVRSMAGWLYGEGRLPGKPRRETILNIMAAILRAGVWIVDIVVFSAVLQLGLLLPMAEIFHRVTLAGIGLNSLAVPLMTVLLAAAVPVVLLGLVAPSIAVFLGKPLSGVMAGLFRLTALPRLPHWLSFRVPTPPIWVALGFGLAIILIAFALGRYTKLLAAATLGAGVCGLLIALCPFPPAIPKGVLEVTELDCGGGEGLLMVLPDQTTVLVGSGGGSRRWLGGSDPLRGRRWDPGENIISPYLWSRGIKKIGVFILPDTAGDHLSGVPSLLRNFRVRKFWYGFLPSVKERAELVNMLGSRHVQARQLQVGEKIEVGTTRFAVFRPSPPGGFGRSRPAAAALLLRVSNAEGSVLLAADLSRSSQAMVLREDQPLESEVLQAAPSELNSQFLAHARPKVVLEDPTDFTAPPAINNPMPFQFFDISERGAITVTMNREAINIRSDSKPEDGW